jgi:hypothetical protein
VLFRWISSRNPNSDTSCFFARGNALISIDVFPIWIHHISSSFILCVLIVGEVRNHMAFPWHWNTRWVLEILIFWDSTTCLEFSFIRDRQGNKKGQKITDQHTSSRYKSTSMSSE